MKCTVYTRQGAETIDTNAPYMKQGKVYKALVKYFDDWINKQPKETQLQYFGSFEEMEGGSYLDSKGAILEMYYTLCEYVEENNLKILKSDQFYKIDFEGVIQA